MLPPLIIRHEMKVERIKKVLEDMGLDFKLEFHVNIPFGWNPYVIDQLTQAREILDFA